MRTVKTLKPGQDGTKALLTRFGPSLLYVRYRYDEDRREHVKTVELVVQRRSRDGEATCRGSRAPDAQARWRLARSARVELVPPGPDGWHCGPVGGRRTCSSG